MAVHDSREAEGLTMLGGGATAYPTSPDEATLETFANAHAERDYDITLDCPEFTSLCPMTGQPDFGRIVIDYVPGERCIESKSLKLYLFSFRNHGSFGEAIVNRILDDVVAACAPRRATVRGSFAPRGGITIDVTASFPARISPGTSEESN
jgi:7-cyano-7-deazaguanine reductase